MRNCFSPSRLQLLLWSAADAPLPKKQQSQSASENTPRKLQPALGEYFFDKQIHLAMVATMSV
jgi:hypothetical protein